MSRRASLRSRSKTSFSSSALLLEEEHHLPEVDEEEDECTFVDEEDEVETDIQAESVPRSVHSRTGARKSTTSDFLSQTLKRQPALDIQQRGGIDFAAIATLCKDKEDIYGKPNTKQ